MKILIVNTLYSPYKIGGAEVSVQLLSESLVDMGHNVRVLCLHEDEQRKTSLINGVEVVYLPLKNIYWPFSDTRPAKFKRLLWHIIDMYNPLMKMNVATELEQFSPDVVHTNNLAGFSVAIWDEVKKRNIRLVHTTRDYYLFHPNCTLFSNGINVNPNLLSVKIWSLFKKYKSRKVDVAVGISKFISSLHDDNDFFPNAKHTFIYNPVEIPMINTEISDKLRIGFIGRLTEEKGFDEFCKIATNYRNNASMQFVAAGRFGCGEQAIKLKQKAEKLNINVLGFVPLSRFLSVVDVVVLPIKWQEPFGRTVVECALANKIVYTNKIGGVTELFDVFENSIFIFSQNIKFNNIQHIKENIGVKVDLLSSTVSEKYVACYGKL